MINIFIPRNDSKRLFKHTAGFSLLELLVVFGIIAILASLLFTALESARQKTRTVVCANNLKELQLCWHLYLVDNKDVLVPNNFIYNGRYNIPFITNASWCPGIAPTDDSFQNIRSGLLFPYNTSVEIYHCPSDRSTVTGTGQPRTRSYDMSQSVNGYPEFNPAMYAHFPSFKKFAQIVKPSPARLFVFMDVHEDGITDSIFGTPTRVWGDLNTWWDIPANRHNQGANFSFADGHVERWHWTVPKKVQGKFPQPLAPGESEDHNRVLAGTRQSF